MRGNGATFVSMADKFPGTVKLDESPGRAGGLPRRISFTRHFYQPRPLRTLAEIRADILAVEKEAEGLLDELLKGGAK